MRLQFGDVTLDGSRRQVLRDGAVVRLSSRGLRLLEILIESRPRVVTKRELAERLWPDEVAGEGALACLVNDVRAALSDEARAPSVIRTAHGVGYAFAGGEVREEGAEPTCRHLLLWGARELGLGDGANLVGRERGCEVWLPNPSVSRRQARIVVTGGRAVLEDLGGRNTTRVGGRRAEGRVELADGDALRFGSVLLTYRRTDVEGSTEDA